MQKINGGKGYIYSGIINDNPQKNLSYAWHRILV